MLAADGLVLVLAGVVFAQSDAAMASDTICIQDARDGKPVPGAAYCVKPGHIDKGSLWTTVEQPSPTTWTYHPTPPSEWKTVTAEGTVVPTYASVSATVFIRAPGYELATVALPLLGGPGKQLTLSLEPVGQITGTVLRPDGKGIPNAPVLIGALPDGYFEWGLGSLAHATTGQEGNFTISSYPRRFPLLLTTYVESYGPAYVLVAESEVPRTHELRPCAAATLTGAVRLSKGTVNHATIVVRALTPEGIPYASLMVDARRGSGRIRAERLPPGRTTLSVFGESSYFLFFGTYFEHTEEFQLECGKTLEADIMISMPNGEN